MDNNLRTLMAKGERRKKTKKLTSGPPNVSSIASCREHWNAQTPFKKLMRNNTQTVRDFTKY